LRIRQSIALPQVAQRVANDHISPDVCATLGQGNPVVEMKIIERDEPPADGAESPVANPDLFGDDLVYPAAVETPRSA